MFVSIDRMGSYTSRTRTNIVSKPLEVLPATESWSTLDAFQATVKKDEHHELINRSKTQRSLVKTNSFSMKRRIKTLHVIPANSSSSSIQQSRIKQIPITAKTQATLSTVRSVSQEDKHPSQFSESALNARRPTHFYEVRQAMVNRKTLKQLESIASIPISHFEDQNIKENLSDSETESSETNSANNQVVVSSSNSSTFQNVKVHSETNLASKPVVVPRPISSTNKTEVAVSQPTEPNLSQTKLQNKPAVAIPSAVQLDTKAEASQSATLPLHNTFKVDPAPHATFAPISLPSELELKCQETVSGLGLLSSEESKRKELEAILQQWEKSGQLDSIEAHALSVPPWQTTTIAELASSLVDTNAGYIKDTEENELYIQIAQAYCIYVWIANNIMYDIEQWKAYQSGDESNSLVSSIEAEEVLDTRMTICTGYANIFKALALAAGLEAGTVNGHVKQWKFLSEEKPDTDITFKPSRGNAHTWNTVSNNY